MTAIALWFDDREAFVACDSLQINTATGERSTTTKCLAIPHKRLLVASAGSVFLGRAWAWSHFDRASLSTVFPNKQAAVSDDPVEIRAQKVVDGSAVFELGFDEHDHLRAAAWRGPEFRQEWLRPGFHAWLAGEQQVDGTVRAADGPTRCRRAISEAAVRYPNEVAGRLQCSTLNARRIEQWLLGELPILAAVR